MSTETKIRDAFDRHQSDVQRSPRAWIDVERRIARSHKRRYVAAGVISAGVVAGAVVTPLQLTSNRAQDVITPLDSSTPSPSPSVSLEPTPTPTPTPPPPLEIPSSWHEFRSSELGISFFAPYIPDKGSATVQFDEPPGLDEGLGYWWGPAHGISKDYRAGREYGSVDNINWTTEGSSYVVRQMDGSNLSPYTVTPQRVVERPDGLRAIIFDSWEYDRLIWGDSIKPFHVPVAVLNYPKGFDSDLTAINFSFNEEWYQDVTIDDLETVILSVEFSESGPRR